jgi:hypothetical protein
MNQSVETQTANCRDGRQVVDDFLRWHSPERDFLFEDFGFAEVVFTPLFIRFWFPTMRVSRSPMAWSGCGGGATLA